MKTRAITAFFFVIVMIGSFLFGADVFVGFYALLATACLYEYFGMMRQGGHLPATNLGLSLGFLVFLLVFDFSFIGLQENRAWFLILFPVLVFISQLFKNQRRPFDQVGATLLGFFYVILPFICFTSLAFQSNSFDTALPLGFLIFLWSNDTGAYLVGRYLGRTKLFERISPKKTWEGFVGGVLISVFVGWLFSGFNSQIPVWVWMTMAGIIGVSGTLGDLVESMLKRSLEIKDSGKLLPGHGGLLDRFDGLLVAAPCIFLFLKLVI